MAAFAVPNFNLLANVWHNPGVDPSTYPSPDFTTPANLANGRVAHILNSQKRLPAQSELGASGSILFPINTDIRDASLTPNPDVIEIPAGSGRYYWVAFCDDIAKGFSNEHRWAVCPKVWTNGFFNYRWPTPMP